MDWEQENLDEKYKQLDEVIERYGQEKGQLIKVLKEAQEIFGYLPEEVQTYIAGKMNMPVSEVNGVVTFYALFSTEPQGKYSINVCLGTACYVQGAQGILDEFRSQLGLNGGDTSDDRLFTVKSSRCVGACGLAPVVTINGGVHGKLNRKDVPKLIRKYKRQAEVKDDDKRLERPERDQAQVFPPH